ncbi:alpha/beta hydrolase [Propylenella binzhouense]|uniref:Alpha/beta hydrolase n=1 Tax=Propylenella binzhouense TaxID=2555902 RepID=A0A964WSS7_9HYPH|nr:alpha/beta hydrolase [Propylenella binzhouense]MYZ47283.1 alpha/beta hydrolase [Propylenella binzhouense]
MTILPETKALLDAAAQAPGPKLHEMDPVTAREVMGPMMLELDLPVEPLKEMRDITIPGPAGPIPARLFVPDHGEPEGPVLVYYHGGGWVVGSLDGCAGLCSQIANRLGIRVVSVDYRMAPEHVFPAAVDDSIAAAVWVAGSPAELGGKAGGVLTGGDSAGGNLATVVSASDKVKVRAQLLFYPVTDISKKHASYSEFASGYFLEEAGMDWFRDHYLPTEADWTDPRVSPLLAESVAHLPPTVIMTAGLDVLRDEGRAYAARLAESGVRLLFSEAHGLIHGIMNMRAALPSSMTHVERAIDDLGRLIRETA